ncbi:hypothetical protein Tco_0244186 [Tanacetum coccineum]
MLRIEILHDVVGTSGYPCGVLWSFPVERIEQRIDREGKIEINAGAFFSYFTIKVKELDGIPVALVARFGVVSKSADRILVSHGGKA